MGEMLEKKKDITVNVEIKDDIGNEFKADVVFKIDELQRLLIRHGYKIVKN